MKKLLLVTGLLLLCCSSSVAQDTPTIEVFGGYTYNRIVSAGSGLPINGNGWEAAADWNVNSWLGFKGDFEGAYCCHQQYFYGFLGGPQISLRKEKYTVFVHALVGGAHAQGLFTSDTDLAWALGGGVDWNVTRLVAIRVGQVDYFGTHFLNRGQNDLRVSAGFVFRFGKR